RRLGGRRVPGLHAYAGDAPVDPPGGRVARRKAPRQHGAALPAPVPAETDGVGSREPAGLDVAVARVAQLLRLPPQQVDPLLVRATRRLGRLPVTLERPELEAQLVQSAHAV